MSFDKRVIRQLKKIVGAENLGTEDEDLIVYGHDASLITRARPDIVAHPRSSKDVQQIVKLAADEGIPVVPRGAGTGLSGGSVPTLGGIVLHFNLMDRIRDIDGDNMVAVVEPGVSNFQLKNAVADVSLFYPPDPSSMKVCTLGGNVAENAGGPHSYKYGPTSNYLLGLEAVLPSGEIIETGGKIRRNVSGYNITGLLAGSEGTLGIITEITLRLLPSPKKERAVLIAFAELAAAGETVPAISKAGIIPAALEIIDQTAIACAEKYHAGVFPKDAAAVLLIVVDGDTDEVDYQIDTIVDICQSSAGTLIRLSDCAEDIEEQWSARQAVSAALARMGPTKIGEDICVPISNLSAMMKNIKEISARHHLTIAVFGHAGEGVLHPNILTDRRDAATMKRTQKVMTELFEAAVALGGAISSEHGIGSTKAPFMKSAINPATLFAMRQIKQALDPQNIMNPGKIFRDS